MKYKVLIILFTVSIILSGCLEKPLIFVGESDTWKVHYEVAQVKKLDEECNTTSGYIRYLGTEPMPERLELDIDKVEGAIITLDENGMFHLLNGCSNATEGSEFKAAIKWENQTETIPLILN
ncbi:MAG: hypothetical protein H9W80_14830 [Enterococcus sp.]|nr:hypothetical protein [Enterococcus sp.]